MRGRRTGMVESLEPRRLFSRIWYVDASSPAHVPDGNAWSTAYRDLQQALSASTSGDEIHVADGTYKPTATTDRTLSFLPKSGVSLLGGYAGFGAGNPDARDWSAYVTTLSGDIGVTGTNTDNSYHVVVG